jgi:hypothetical protein
MKPSPDTRQLRGAQVAYALIVIALMIAGSIWVFGPKHIHSSTTIDGVGTTTLDCEGTYNNTNCTFSTSP